MPAPTTATRTPSPPGGTNAPLNGCKGSADPRIPGRPERRLKTRPFAGHVGHPRRVPDGVVDHGTPPSALPCAEVAHQSALPIDSCAQRVEEHLGASLTEVGNDPRQDLSQDRERPQ